MVLLVFMYRFFFFKQKTAYEMRISDWSSDVCSSDLKVEIEEGGDQRRPVARLPETLLHDIIQGVDEIAGMFTLARERGRIVECGPAVALGLRAAGPASGAGVPRTRIMRASRSEEHTSELQSLMRISYAVFCLKKNK